jgi:hypothetical protein
MIKYVLPAAVAAIALMAAPGVSRAQMAQPMQPAQPNGNMTNTNATIVGQPQPGPYDQAYGQMQQPQMVQPQMGQPIDGQPMPGYYTQPVTPRTTWIPGHYDWDPSTSNYVYTEGQYVEAPTTTAQWVPGHWVQTPTSWIWIDGGWK